jgi:hypothetical protein
MKDLGAHLTLRLQTVPESSNDQDHEDRSGIGTVPGEMLMLCIVQASFIVHLMHT